MEKLRFFDIQEEDGSEQYRTRAVARLEDDVIQVFAIIGTEGKYWIWEFKNYGDLSNIIGKDEFNSYLLDNYDRGCSEGGYHSIDELAEDITGDPLAETLVQILKDDPTEILTEKATGEEAKLYGENEILCILEDGTQWSFTDYDKAIERMYRRGFIY